MKCFVLGFLLISCSATCFAAIPTSLNAANFTLAVNNANNLATNAMTNNVISNPKANVSGLGTAPVDPHVTQETQSVFQNTANNLNLYVTQLQCQSQGINSDTCNNQTTTNQSNTMMNNVNKFLFDSVTSELGIGVEVHF